MEAKQLLLSSPTSAQTYADLGHALHRRVDYEAAIRCYRLGLEIDADNDRLHCLMGLTHHNLGNHSLAILHYTKATEANESNAEAHYYLGFILIQESRLSEAVQSLRMSLSLNPDLNPAYYYLGISLERLGQHEEARAVLIQRLQKTAAEPDGAVVFTLGELLSGRRRYKTHRCHTQAVTNALLQKLQKEQIHVFGDSHRSVFNHLNNVICHNVGSGTAYNLLKTTSSTGAGNRIHAIAKGLNTNTDCLLLVFGEIDCMEHLFKNHYRTGEHPDALLDILVERYISFATQLTDAGFRVLIYGPAFSGLAMNSYGGLRERNVMLKRFNQKLSAACEESGSILFASLDWLLVGAEMTPMPGLSEDGRHLDDFPKGSKVLQAMVLGKFLEAAQAEQRKSSELEQYPSGSNNLALEKPYILLEGRSALEEQSPPRTGLVTPAGAYSLALREGVVGTLIIDLLDHVKIGRVTLTLSTVQCDDLMSAELHVFGLDQQQQRLIDHRMVSQMRSARLAFTPSATIARALVLRVRVVQDGRPVGLSKLVLQDLCVEAYPQHETLIKTGRAL